MSRLLIHILIHRRHCWCFFLRRLFGNHDLGGQHQPGYGSRILQGETHDFGRIDDTGFQQIFILLSFQFRSYLQPLIVMTVIPMALIGVIWGHLLMGLQLTMPSIIGFTSLAGVVVNDSILLVEFLKLRVREGAGVVEAAKLASRQRFRAVLLTSITTVAGLTPLLLEKSMQAQVLVPLATSIVFGLLTTTLLVLLVVPALFSILHDLGMSNTAAALARDEPPSRDTAGQAPCN